MKNTHTYNFAPANQWPPRGLERGSAAAHLLRLRVRIPLGAWKSVCCECCVLSDVSALGWSLVQRSPTECGVSECDCEASIMRRRPWGHIWLRFCKQIDWITITTWPMWTDWSVIYYRAVGLSYNSFDLNAVGVRYEPPPGNILFWVIFLPFPQCLQAN